MMVGVTGAVRSVKLWIEVIGTCQNYSWRGMVTDTGLMLGVSNRRKAAHDSRRPTSIPGCTATHDHD